MEVNLKVNARAATGKGPARQSRLSGQIPAVLYGRDLEPTPLMVEAKEMHKVLSTEAGLNVLINLQLDSKTKFFTMLREVQKHPIRGNLIHIDFVKIDRDVKIQADVPVHVVGDSRGVKEGGVVEHHLWELKVQALPADVPPAFEVDITDVGLGDHLRVSSLVAPKGVDILTALEEIIVSVVEPQIIQIEEAVPAEAVAEGEEAAVPEGEAAAETTGEEEPSE